MLYKRVQNKYEKRPFLIRFRGKHSKADHNIKQLDKSVSLLNQHSMQFSNSFEIYNSINIIKMFSLTNMFVQSLGGGGGGVVGKFPDCLSTITWKYMKHNKK